MQFTAPRTSVRIEETIGRALEREPPGGLWGGLAATADAPAQGDIWRGLERRIGDDGPPGETGLWKAVESRVDPALARPAAVPDVAEEQVVEGDQTLIVIRSPRGNYLRLTPLQRDLWRQMDGTRTVTQLATQAFLQHHQLVPVGDLVNLLRREGFLLDGPADIYRSLAAGLEQRSAEGWGRRVLRALAGRAINIPNIDGAYAAIYRGGGRLLFTRVFAAVWALLVLAGLAAFGGLFAAGAAGGYEVLSLGGSVPLGLAALWAMLLVSFVLHESAHALAVKHFGRTLHGGGIMIYYGMPAAFIDTSDIWRSPRRARILVSAAGPMSDLLVGSLASLAALALSREPASALTAAGGALLFKLAITCFVAVLFNANPLLELDGYFILVDMLRMPDLRRRALAFVTGELPGRLAARAKLGREERILALYGVLTVLYTAFAVVAAAVFWREQLSAPIAGLLGGAWWEKAIGWALLLVIVAPILAAVALTAWGAVRAGVAWLVRRGYGRRPALLAGAGLVVTLALALATTRIGPPGVYWIAPLLWAIALCALLAVQPDYHGAAIAPALTGLLLTAGCSALAAAMRALDTPYWVVPEALAFVFLLLAGFGCLLDVEMRFVPAAELLSTALLLILAFAAGGVALVLAEGAWPSAPRAFHIVASAPAYFGALAVALMLPRLFDLRDSRLIWSLVLLWAGAISETGAYLVNLVRHIPALDVAVAGMWATAWLTHLATLRQITPDEVQWEHTSAISEGQRLARGFQLCYAGCYRLLREVYGERRARAFDDRMDVIAATADWDVTLDRDRARIGDAVRKLPLDEQGMRYAEVLRYTVLIIEEIAGEVFARRAIQAAYDALPWPERETAGRLCFPDTPWARELSASFGDARGGRLRLLRQVDLFLSCDDAELEALAHTIEEQQAAPGTTLLRAGSPSHGVWVVEAGEVLVRSQGQDVAELHRGDAFGALELLSGAEADATYRTTVASTLLFIRAEEYRRLIEGQAPHAGDAAGSAEVVRLLERVPLFTDMPRHTLRGLALIAERRQVAARTAVVRQGQPSGVFYIILDGSAAVLTREEGQKPRLVATIGAKEFFGEIELLRGTPPVATVMTIGPATLLALPHEAIRGLLLGDGGAAASLEQIGSGRLLSLRGS